MLMFYGCRHLTLTAHYIGDARDMDNVTRIRQAESKDVDAVTKVIVTAMLEGREWCSMSSRSSGQACEGAAVFRWSYESPAQPHAR